MTEDYIKDLIDRNLILVCAHRSNGRTKSFRIHDLLRELCLRVLDEEEFFCEPRGIDKRRRSLICDSFKALNNCRLLRVFNQAFYQPLAKSQNVNLRHFFCKMGTLPFAISRLWNLQTLVIDYAFEQIVAPLEIWKMTQLRHIKCAKLLLPDPAPAYDKGSDFVVLGNLQTLAVVTDFRLSEETCRIIPNITKLQMRYSDIWGQVKDHSLFDNLRNLGRLQRLESINLQCFKRSPIGKHKNAFPNSLKKLCLYGDIVCFEDLSMMIGSLPQLEVIKLRGLYNWPEKWSCFEGEFLRLKFLSIEDHVLESWTLDGASHFPVLEKLVLINVRKLKEIPSGIGEISTLQLIRLERCTETLVISAIKLKEEQESFGNYGLQIQVKMGIWEIESLKERVKIEGLPIENIHLQSQTY